MPRPVLVLGLLLAGAGSASASTIDFTGAYAVANWTAVLQHGIIDTSAAPGSVTLKSANDHCGCMGLPQAQDFLFTAFEPATIDFAWAYTSHDMDGPRYDPFGWLLNTVFTRVTSDLQIDCFWDPPFAAACQQQGVISFAVQPGDVFGVRADSIDSAEGSAITIVSNFSATPLTPTAVPEPASLILLGSGLVGLGLRRRTKRL